MDSNSPVQTINPAEVAPLDTAAIYNALADSVQNQAVQQAQAIGASEGAKGPSLAQMNNQLNGISAYNYNRLIQPTVEGLSAGLVTAGRQAALERTLKLALDEARDRYNKARDAYSDRQTAAANGSGSGSGSTKPGANGQLNGVELEVTPTVNPRNTLGGTPNASLLQGASLPIQGSNAQVQNPATFYQVQPTGGINLLQPAGSIRIAR